jgi:hypothetical protein
MFRDMSGLAATIGLAQATAQNSTDAARSAGELASANMLVAAQRDVELERIKAKTTVAALANPNLATGGPRNATEAGAVLNAARELDREQAATGVTGAGTSGSADAGEHTSSRGVGSSRAVFAPASRSHADDAMNRMIWGTAGTSLGSLLPAPGPIALPTPFSAIEDYCWTKVRRPITWTDTSQEIAALENGVWFPSRPDFRAISWRSAGNVEPRRDAEVSTLTHFLTTLTLDVGRFNFFCYAYGDNEIALDMRIPPTGAPSPVRDPQTALEQSTMLNLDTLAQLMARAAGSGADPIRELLGKIRQFFLADNVRELWIYQVSPGQLDNLADAIAKNLKLSVFVFDTRFEFHPKYIVSPPDIDLRGKIASGGTDYATTNIHEFDDYATRFDP